MGALTAWGVPGSADGQLRAPKGLTTDADGNVYVADSQNHRIQVFDATGTFLRQFGSEGTAPGQFKEPWSVAVAPRPTDLAADRPWAGNIYVADTWNHRIQVFDPQGQPLFAWGTFGEVAEATGPGDVLYGPRDIAFDAQGFLYVSDTGNKRVVKYDADGQMVAAVGGLGDAEGLMQEPVGLAVSPEGDVYVADTWNKRIQVFDSDLGFVRAWSIYGWDGQSVVEKPYLAVDGQGNVYATDPEAYRVAKFDRDGKLVAVWGQFGSDLASMNLPTGIDVDSSGRVLVSDSENGRILVFAGN
jgi:DNA-binding beta-propeller fold protein YncE